VGFDINQKRINELMNGHDGTLEIEDKVLKAVLLDKNPVTPSAVEGQLTIDNRQPVYSAPPTYPTSPMPTSTSSPYQPRWRKTTVPI
jgi:hypothetical protein